MRVSQRLSEWRQLRAWRRLVSWLEMLDRDAAGLGEYRSRWDQMERIGHGAFVRLMELEAYLTREERQRFYGRVILVPVDPWLSSRAFMLHLAIERIARFRALSAVP